MPIVAEPRQQQQRSSTPPPPVPPQPAISTDPGIVTAVVGVDTHRDSHTFVMLSLVGAMLGTVVVANSDAGFAQALAWINDLSGGSVTIGMEGTRSYGIGLSRALQAAGLTVLEVEQPTKARRRGRGKTDLIDAEHAARNILAGGGRQPRADGDREALRILTTARDCMVAVRTATANQLKALLRSGNDTDRDLARGNITKTWLLRLQHRTTAPDADTLTRITENEIHRLATTISHLDSDLTANHKELTTLIQTGRHAALLDRIGIGPVNAAQLIIAWSHPGRCRNDAAFANLAGAAPIQASSGNTTRHRLNHGGDRTLNRALHIIALTRWTHCERTRAYITKRRTQGHTDRDTRRILKRYIARETFNILNTP